MGEPEQSKTPMAATMEVNENDEIASRLARYEKYHRRALLTAKYLKALPESKFLKKTVKRLNQCGEFLHFHNYYRIGERRLHKGSFCMNHLLCPLCGARRGLKATKAYMDKVNVLVEADQALKYFHVVLTVKNGASLTEIYNHLMSSLRAMRMAKNDAVAGKREPVEMNKALAGVYSVEVKRGKNSGLWHPHLHMVWIGYEEPDLRQLSVEWKEFTGDSFDVFVDPFDTNDISSFMEVFTYAVKFSSMEPEDQYEAWKALKGERLINAFGLLHGIKIPEALEDEDIENEPYFDEFFIFSEKSGYNFMEELAKPAACYE